MRTIAQRVLGLVPSSADYADVRVIYRRHEGIHVENHIVDQVLDEESEGIGLRVLVQGQWGFAASPRLDPAGLDDLVHRAMTQALCAVGRGPATSLAPALVMQAVYSTPLMKDPFAISIQDKIDLLLHAASAMQSAGSLLKSAEASMDFFQERKVFANTEDSLIEQTITKSGAGLLATASDGSDVQQRSFPQSVPRAIRGQRGDFATAGYEHVESLRLIDHAPRVGEEAVALLTADPCPSTTTTLIVSGTQMAQLVHETAGHPSEMDRVLGSEASLAGGSFMEPQLRGQLRFGTDLVNIVADATLPRGLGSFGYDDEGIPAQRAVIVKDGIFVGYLTSRESARTLNAPSNGAARADGWSRVPLVRMTNVSLEPGDAPLDQLIGTTRSGILMDMNKSLSIDDRRLSFRFGCEIGWEIKNGLLGRMLRNCTYRGITPQFWASCDAVGDASTFRLYGIPSCNKGEPLQVAHVGHGTVPARFRDVRVGL